MMKSLDYLTINIIEPKFHVRTGLLINFKVLQRNSYDAKKSSLNNNQKFTEKEHFAFKCNTEMHYILE